MFAIFVYLPFLMFLPVLLVVGVVFVVVPGGFIIVLGGLYIAVVEFAGLLGLAARQRWRAGASAGRRANTSFEAAPRSARPSRGPRGSVAPRPVAVAFRSHRPPQSASKLAPPRRGADNINLPAPIDGGRYQDRNDGARAA